MTIRPKCFVAAALSALLLGTAMTAPAADKGPGELVRETSEAVLKKLEANQQQLRKDPSAVYGLVRDLVLPHFDFQLMSRFVLAQAWRDASESQRERFTEEFRKLLIRTYGQSLAEYSGQEVEYLPVNADAERSRVTVSTEIEQPNGPSIPVDYMLHESADGWKVFDVSVDGVSLVRNYRSQFNSKVRRDGLDALIEDLAARNSEGSGGQ